MCQDAGPDPGGLAPWPTRPALEPRGEAFPLSYSGVSPAACPSLRCGHPALLVGCVREKQAGLLSCATEPPKEGPKLSISGHSCLKQLIKMPDPQGPVTHSPVFICTVKAEQLLDLAIGENVLKMKPRAQKGHST